VGPTFGLRRVAVPLDRHLLVRPGWPSCIPRELASGCAAEVERRLQEGPPFLLIAKHAPVGATASGARA
jgi:hypothetical protein